ncbi:response regulator [Bradyrhizobium archetypum]|uniref:Response regulator n=1 Tax=Bradyrhizobium archetypum TaxID=2721160 RepID=A0A7Y4M0T0_9BRAD|nr:response regulator [Bradyrhizobium archetypum]NOJ46022.1 response regulator [Bradyrhizobium archetypum]
MPELHGLNALLVEDEGAVALLIEDMLVELGVNIVASVGRLRDACEVARTAALDFALLDVNLGGEMVFPAADILRERQIPFIFSTGYGGAGPTKQFDDVPVIGKPFAIRDLDLTLRTLLKGEPGGTTPRTPG